MRSADLAAAGAAHAESCAAARAKGVVRGGTALIGAGALLLTAAIVGLWQDVRWLSQPFYAFAWWGYILIADGLCAAIRNDSLLTTRRRWAAVLAVGSVTFWFCFEALNLRFRNWYYVEVFPVHNLVECLPAGLFAVVSFATVFLGIFESFELFGAFGLFAQWRGAGRVMGRSSGWVVQAIGVVMAVAAVVWPCYLAPLIWGSLSLIVDPWNARHGRSSLLADLQRGEYGRCARWLVAGLWCGLLWESLNFWAPQKWIYTVRGLEELKLFEMPLLGFLGFPALALDCVAAASWYCAWLARGGHWEERGAIRAQIDERRFARSLPVQMIFWCVIGYCVAHVNVGSVEVALLHLGLTEPEVATLHRHEIRRPRHVLKLDAERSRKQAVLNALKWSEDRWDRLVERSRLYTFKGIGARHGQMLEAIGVGSVADLASYSPASLHEALARGAAASDRDPPRLDMVRVWVIESHRRHGSSDRTME